MLKCQHFSLLHVNCIFRNTVSKSGRAAEFTLGKQCLRLYLRERCCGEILSFTNANAASLIQLLGGTEGNRVYSDEGVGITLTSSAGGFGGKTGHYDVALPIKVDTKSGFQLAHPGDSIDLAYPKMFSPFFIV